MVARRKWLWGAVAIAAALAAWSATAEGGFRRYARLKSDVASLREKNLKLAEKNAALLATQESKLAQTDSERRRLEAENLLRLEQEAQQRAQREQAEAQATLCG